MSEQKSGFMVELDAWTKTNIVDLFYNTDRNPEAWNDVVAEVKRVVRAKVLESYHNGQSAGPRKVYKPR